MTMQPYPTDRQSPYVTLWSEVHPLTGEPAERPVVVTADAVTGKERCAPGHHRSDHPVARSYNHAADAQRVAARLGLPCAIRRTV